MQRRDGGRDVVSGRFVKSTAAARILRGDRIAKAYVEAIPQRDTYRYPGLTVVHYRSNVRSWQSLNPS
jgi:hypothetical protein